jgi:hypothetical protein
MKNRGSWDRDGRPRRLGKHYDILGMHEDFADACEQVTDVQSEVNKYEEKRERDTDYDLDFVQELMNHFEAKSYEYDPYESSLSGLEVAGAYHRDGDEVRSSEGKNFVGGADASQRGYERFQYMKHQAVH